MYPTCACVVSNIRRAYNGVREAMVPCCLTVGMPRCAHTRARTKPVDMQKDNERKRNNLKKVFFFWGSNPQCWGFPGCTLFGNLSSPLPENLKWETNGKSHFPKIWARVTLLQNCGRDTAIWNRGSVHASRLTRVGVRAAAVGRYGRAQNSHRNAKTVTDAYGGSAPGSPAHTCLRCGLAHSVAISNISTHL